MDIPLELQKARAELIIEEPTVAAQLFNLDFTEDNRVPTAYVNKHKKLGYNKNWMLSLPRKEQVGILIHESLHVVLKHVIDLDKSVDQDLANQAMDYIINSMIRSSPKFGSVYSLPRGCLLSDEFDWEKMSWRAVYNILRSRNPPKPKDPSQGKSGDGTPENGLEGRGDGDQIGNDVEPNAKPNKAEDEKISQDIDSSLYQSHAVSKMNGKSAGFFEMIIGELLKSKLPWTSILSQFLGQILREDYSFRRINRKHPGFFLPGLYNEHIKIINGLDSSGSISDEQLTQFNAELNGQLAARDIELTVIQSDAQVQSVEVFNSCDFPVKLKIKGRGGTSFIPVFDYIEKNGLEPACLIYLTDLYGDFPKFAPDYPVLWVVTSDQKPPWGDYCRLD